MAIFEWVFMPDEAVDDMHALVFERPRPLDVALLVETRLELDQHGDLLAVAGRVEQGGDDRRVATDAVERHLDGQDVGVAGGAFEPVDDRLERFVGTVDEDVVLADRGEDVEIRRPSSPSGGAGTKGLSLRSGRSMVARLMPLMP